MAWILVLLVVILAGIGAWALFRVDDEEGTGGSLLGGRSGPKELPPPPPLPGYRPPPEQAQRLEYSVVQPESAQHTGSRELDFPFVPATIWKRFVARLIDGMISGLFTGFITFVVLVAAVRRNNPGTSATVLIVAILFFTMFYEVAFIAVLGQTPGKMLTGIRVISALDGATPTVAQAFVRWLAPGVLTLLPRLLPASGAVKGQISALTGLMSFLMYAWALWDPRKQGLHDKAAQTLVERFR